MQVAEQSAHLLLIVAQKIPGGGCVRDLKRGAVIQQQIRPVLADPLGHPQGGNGALFGAVGILGGAGMNAGYVAFPPLPPCLDLAVVIGIQLPPARLMQMIQKIGDVHVFVSFTGVYPAVAMVNCVNGSHPVNGFLGRMGGLMMIPYAPLGR